MDAIFTHDKMEEVPLRGVDDRVTADIPAIKAARGRRYLTSAKNQTNAPVADDLLQMVTILLHNDEFRAVESIVSHTDDRSVADALVTMIASEAELKTAQFQFLKAKKLFALIVCGELFTMRQREDAAVRNYLLQKKHFENRTEDLLAMTEDYRKRFPEGIFGEYMTSEAVSLLLSKNDLPGAVIEMKRLIRRYPTSQHNEYCRFLYATTLQETLDRASEALDEYKKYITLYPQGKYEEDVLYRIIQIERSRHGESSGATYAGMYLRKYPHGRWNGEVRAMDVV